MGLLRDRQFSIFAEIAQNFLRESSDRGDLANPVSVMEASFYYHRINPKMNGMQNFIHKPLHGHSFWQNMRFWEKVYYGM